MFYFTTTTVSLKFCTNSEVTGLENHQAVGEKKITRVAGASLQTKDDTYKYRLKGMYQVLLSFVRKHRDTQHRTPHQPKEYCRLALK